MCRAVGGSDRGREGVLVSIGLVHAHKLALGLAAPVQSCPPKLGHSRHPHLLLSHSTHDPERNSATPHSASLLRGSPVGNLVRSLLRCGPRRRSWASAGGTTAGGLPHRRRRRRGPAACRGPARGERGAYPRTWGRRRRGGSRGSPGVFHGKGRKSVSSRFLPVFHRRRRASRTVLTRLDPFGLALPPAAVPAPTAPSSAAAPPLPLPPPEERSNGSRSRSSLCASPSAFSTPGPERDALCMGPTMLRPGRSPSSAAAPAAPDADVAASAACACA